MAKAAVTNQHIATRIGMTDSAVSRIRNGTRHPSIEVMQKIAAAYNWGVGLQAEAQARGNYAEVLERRLANVHGWAADRPLPAPAVV